VDKSNIIYRFIAIFILSLMLTNCTSEWTQGSRCGAGYRTHDVCFNKGEQIIFIENEQFHAQKEALRQGFVYGQGMILNY